MKGITVDQAAVRSASHGQAGAAQQVTDQASAELIDTGVLAPAFGLIGANFLATLAQVGQRRQSALGALAMAHGDASASATSAGTAYACCDDAGAREVTV